MRAVLAAACAGAAVLLLQAPHVPLPRVARSATDPDRPGVRAAARALVSVLAGAGAGLFVGGPLAGPAVLVGAGVGWWLLGRAEPSGVRRDREQTARDLPHLVRLVGAGLRSGAAVGDAVALACAALPGAAATRLQDVPHRLGLGVSPVRVWTEVADDEALAPLGRALARAHESGAPVVAAVERLGDELARQHRGQVEDRARAVGVRAALPLGLCLLPSFLLLGVVPLVAGLLTGIVP